MKFSTKNLYIESYTKCSNCGILLYEAQRAVAIAKADKLYCTAWCEDWDAQRPARRASATVVAAG